MEGFQQSLKLSLPPPPYTYKRGLAYSVGEDRYDQVGDSIYAQATSFEVSGRLNDSRIIELDHRPRRACYLFKCFLVLIDWGGNVRERAGPPLRLRRGGEHASGQRLP